MENRCPWAETELNRHYHDTEWGVPSHDDRHLFEMLLLEGAQAGLSWSTILRKRESYRVALDHFDPRKIARYDEKKRVRLMANPGIVRNRLKVESLAVNARAFLQVAQEFGTFDRFIWQFVDGRPKQSRLIRQAQIPAKSTDSDAMSRALLARGFKFVGSTICYAYMQATGMVNDHLVSCPRYAVCANLR